jgi:Double zinc ribbon
VIGAIVLWLVLQPLIRPSAPRAAGAEPIDPEETPKGIALAALKEIEFDRETGKLSDSDYQSLRTKYTAEALAALRHDPEPSGTDRGSDDVETMIAAKVRALRFASASKSSDAPESFPSSGPACSSCGPRPEADAVYCSSCGRRLPVRMVCDQCATALVPGSRYCESCGRQVAA